MDQLPSFELMPWHAGMGYLGHPTFDKKTIADQDASHQCTGQNDPDIRIDLPAGLPADVHLRVLYSGFSRHTELTLYALQVNYDGVPHKIPLVYIIWPLLAFVIVYSLDSFKKTIRAFSYICCDHVIPSSFYKCICSVLCPKMSSIHLNAPSSISLILAIYLS